MKKKLKIIWFTLLVMHSLSSQHQIRRRRQPSFADGTEVWLIPPVTSDVILTVFYLFDCNLSFYFHPHVLMRI